MGIQRELTLKEVKVLFPLYTFSTLFPSVSGVMDTTYISEGYILKFYERDIEKKISYDSNLLLRLHKSGLNVTRLLANSKGWFLYEKIQGEMPKSISLFHIQALARFMAKFHTLKLQGKDSFIKSYNIKSTLLHIKRSQYRFYKELEVLKNYNPQNDGFIHGDLFTDNCVFLEEKIGVFDFIDGGNGSYVFDIAVALLSFNPSNRNLYIKVFLSTYNQKAPKKITQIQLLRNIKIASLFYGMLRLYEQKDIKRAKKLIFR